MQQRHPRAADDLLCAQAGVRGAVAAHCGQCGGQPNLDGAFGDVGRVERDPAQLPRRRKVPVPRVDDRDHALLHSRQQHIRPREIPMGQLEVQVGEFGDERGVVGADRVGAVVQLLQPDEVLGPGVAGCSQRLDPLHDLADRGQGRVGRLGPPKLRAGEGVGVGQGGEKAVQPTEHLPDRERLGRRPRDRPRGAVDEGGHGHRPVLDPDQQPPLAVGHGLGHRDVGTARLLRQVQNRRLAVHVGSWSVDLHEQAPWPTRVPGVGHLEVVRLGTGLDAEDLAVAVGQCVVCVQDGTEPGGADGAVGRCGRVGHVQTSGGATVSAGTAPARAREGTAADVVRSQDRTDGSGAAPGTASLNRTHIQRRLRCAGHVSFAAKF